MKAIILAAGSGTRMGKYTENLPKGMLQFNGKTLIEWQIKKFREVGIKDIVIITGYKKETIVYPGVQYFHNPNYAETNMLETIMCARSILNTDVIISYSDILFTTSLIVLVKNCTDDIGISVDKNWRDYWKLRYGTTENDLESLTISKEGYIIELGKPVNSSQGIDYRYIGLNRFSKKGIKQFVELYDKKKLKNESWQQSGKPFLKGYMTDILNELIQDGSTLKPIITQGGWLEFDTTQDYEITLNSLKENKIDQGFF